MYKANNPIGEMMREAQQAWPQGGSIHHRIQCLVSIGTGNPGNVQAGDRLSDVLKTLKAIASATEDVEKDFRFRWEEELVNTNKYFRFNVTHGLEEVGIEEHAERSIIAACTAKYLREDVVGALKEFERTAGSESRAYLTSTNPH